MRFAILGSDDLLQLIANSVGRLKSVILSGNVHAFNLAFRSPWLCGWLNQATAVRIDGVGVRLGLGVLGYSSPPRATWADFAWQLAAFAEPRGFTFYFLGGRPGVAHYSAAKAGIVGFTRTLAKEVGPFGITANAIAPGFVATELIGQFTDDMRERLHRQNPVGRMCRPEEVAALVAFLCSTHAAFINGECVCIDGGRRDFYWG